MVQDFNNFSGCQKYLYEIQNIAKSRKGQCLSLSYFNSKQPLKFKCKCGYIWEACADSIKTGTWCPQCAGNIKLKIEDAQALASIHNGKCLSKRYINNNIKLKWECHDKHIWKARYNDIKHGKWCPKCATKQRWKTRRTKIKKGIIKIRKCIVCGKNIARKE